MADRLQNGPEPDPGDTLGLLPGAIEALSDGFVLFDDDGKIVLSNARFSALHSDLTDLVRPGTGWDFFLREAGMRGVFPPEAVTRLRNIEARLEAGEAPETIEFEMPGGRYGQATLSITRQGGIVLTMRDVTATRRVREREREADLLLRRVLEACPANVLMSRMSDGEIIYRSPAAAGLLGEAGNTDDFFASRGERADFITALLPNGQVGDMPVTCRNGDGSTFPGSVSARVIDYRNEDVVVSTVEDLSGQVAMENQLAVQREIIFQAEKMSALGELLAGVAHELNNPLSVVVGHALMLREEATDPDVVRRIEKIGKAAERCTGIVKTFLAMARQQPATLVPVPVSEIIANAVDAFEQGTSGGSLQISREIPEGLPPVKADEDQISHVLINLLTNAWQAAESSGKGGNVHISARRAGTGMLELRIADDGPGVPAELRSRIFDPLFTTKEVGAGTGIGLAFCHRVVTSHGGQIRLAKANRTGATFVLELPLAGPAGGPARAQPGAAADHGARILVVEDEPDVAEFIDEVLRRDGHLVDFATSGEAALEMLESGSYRIVLSDLNMPGLGGKGLFEALRRGETGLADRLGFITGDTMGPAARSFLDATARPYLEKPVTPSDLRGLVGRMLGTTTGGERP